MSTLRDPVGPKGRNVYMRRRILVLLGFLALVIAVVLIILRPGSSGGATGAREVKVPDDLVAVEQQDQAAAQEAEAGEGEPAACVAGQLVVTPITDSQSYGPEHDPLLSLSVENRGQEPCAVDLGTATLSFEVTSGSDLIWRSADCQRNGDHRVIVLLPGEPVETEGVPWNRERSSPETCELPREKVVAGGASYHLSVSAAEVSGTGTAQFQLY